MIPHKKPMKSAMLMLGLILSAQFCCCFIPIRWRWRVPPRAPQGGGILSETIQTAWEAVSDPEGWGFPAVIE